MHYLSVITGFLPLLACGQNIILSNEDGWAEQNIRNLYDTLGTAGARVLLSAPAHDKSGTGSSDAPATTVDEGCQFESCPAGSPAVNHSSTDDGIWYVNSYPAAAMGYGIETIAPQYFNMSMDLALTGPNVGSTLGTAVLTSASVGAATRAVLLGVPAIAFSGLSGSPAAWDVGNGLGYPGVYSALSVKIVQTLLETSKPYLPNNTWLNVNYPTVGEVCSYTPAGFNIVLSRINSVDDKDPKDSTPPDVSTCGSTRLPTEEEVIKKSATAPPKFHPCVVSISVGRADTKGDASAEEQAVVLEKLGNIFTCLKDVKGDAQAMKISSMVLRYSLLLVGVHWVWTTYV